MKEEEGGKVALLPNQTWVCLPTCSKANILILGCGEGKCNIYCRAPSNESRQLVLKRPKLPEDFQGKVFKDGGVYVGGRVWVCD